MFILRTWIGYGDLTGKTAAEEDLHAVLSSLERRGTFLLLARINATISLYQQRPELAAEIEPFLRKNLLPQDLRGKLANISLDQPGREQGVFHRHQLLSLMGRVLGAQSSAGAKDPQTDTEARLRLGVACLMMNDVLSPPEHIQVLRAAAEAGPDRVDDELFARLIFSSEMARVPEITHSIARLDEFLAIFERGGENLKFSDGRTLSNLLGAHMAVGLRHYNHMTYAILTNYAYYSKSLQDLIEKPALFNIDANVIFENMSFTDVERQAFFDETATDIESLADSIGRLHFADTAHADYDLTQFRAKPLVYTGSASVATLIDFQFLTEKLSSGLYHTILNALDGEDRKLFMAYWGRVFETYLNDRLGDVFPPISDRLYRRPYFDIPRKMDEAFDSFLDYGNSVIAIQTKGGYLKRAAKYQGNTGSLLAEFDKKFGLAASQLANGLERAFNRDINARLTFSERVPDGRATLRFKVEDTARVKAIYPVVMIQDQAANTGFAERRLERILRDELAHRNIDANLVRPLSLLGAEECERLTGCLDQVSMTEVLEAYANRPENPILIFRDFLGDFIRRHRINSRPNEWTDKRFAQIHKDILAHFKPEAIPQLIAEVDERREGTCKAN